MKFRYDLLAAGVILAFFFAGTESLYAQQEKGDPLQVAQVAEPAVSLEPGVISLDFREAEIQTVLQALARKAKINIVSGKDVTGLVSIHLESVTWEQALDTIVKTYGFGYEKDSNVILVTTLEELKTRREAVKDLVEIEPVTTRIIQLRFLDAADVQAFLEPQLTAQGKISVLEMTGQKGWSFGSVQAGGGGSEQDRAREEREKARSKAVVITDTPTTIDRLEKILAKIDVMPKQILIEARIMEVDRDLLRDLGMDIGTGGTGASQAATNLPVLTPAKKEGVGAAGVDIAQLGASILSTTAAPAIFGPKGSLGTGEATNFKAGLEFLFRRLRGMQVEIVVRALEEDIRTNTLSSPHILTLSGQEARILVGKKYPILETQVSGSDSSTTTSSLSYYQDIGIELFVVPQVSGERHIDMIIHPVVSVQNGTVTGSGNVAYPILDTREAETQVVMEDGETIVIGGLLKDVKAKSRQGIPFLGKIPIFGAIFSRATTDIEKIDLLIFITARIVEPGAVSSEETEELRKQYEEFLHEKMSKDAPGKRAPSSRKPAESPGPGNRGLLYQKH